MNSEQKSKQKQDLKADGVPRAGVPDDGVEVGKLYVFRVSETGKTEPGVEKDRNNRDRCHCGLTGVRGYVVDVRENSSRFKTDAGDDREFEMIQVYTTAPCYAIRGGGDETAESIHLLEPGANVLVPANHALGEYLEHARHPTHTIELSFVPGERKKTPTRNGFYPRNWTVKMHGGLVSRATIPGLAVLPALPPVGQNLPQLPG